MKNCNLRSDPKTAAWYEEEIRKIDPKILELRIARPALRALINGGIYTLEMLRTTKVEDLKEMHGMGPAALQKLQAVLR